MIGFGASALGNVFGPVSIRDGARAAHYALDCGINLFDVSPYYGQTLAEERLGTALVGRRADVILATKCGRYGADQFDFSAAAVTSGLEASLRRLQTDHVDLLQVHDVEFGSLEQIVNETIPALRRLQEQGKTRFIGITGYWPGLLAHIARQVPVDTVLNYCHANLLMDDMDRLLTVPMLELGVGVLNASPLHMGLLAGGPVPEWHPAPPSVREAAAAVAAICVTHRIAPATLAIHDCLRLQGVSSTFVGLSSEAQVNDALAALTFAPARDALDAIQEIVEPIYNTTWPSGRYSFDWTQEAVDAV